MKLHELTVLKHFYESTVKGGLYDLRKDDGNNFKLGDLIHYSIQPSKLQEVGNFDMISLKDELRFISIATSDRPEVTPEDEVYQISNIIGDKLLSNGLQSGYVILSLKKLVREDKVDEKKA